ncbi:MAG: hypothetical protein JRJ59_00940 [Deltaproteobacteria bacterium]|nr:hypothetical protein [Deltaproteobacteria bacterium]
METIGLIGGGVMGAGLARHFLAQGLLVSLVEADQNLAQKARQRLDKTLSKDVARGRLEPDQAARRLANLSAGQDLSRLQAADLVIEAVPEDLNLKKRVLAAAENKLRPQAILATNTSALSVSALAAALSRPERFLGTHFFNPAQVMPLVEVVPGLETGPEVIHQTLAFLSQAGKRPIRVKERPGFLVNRILGAYMNEALWLLEETAGIAELEAAAKEMGLPLGPAVLGDMAGWDVIHAANKTLAQSYGQRFEVPPLLAQLDSLARHGLKTGRGLFDHSVQPARPTQDLAPLSRNLDQDQLQEVKTRLILSIIAESVRCLDEDLVSAPDLDQALIMGAGLKQGPLAWADQIGLDRVLDHLERFQGRFGPRFWPVPLLKIYVSSGHTGRSAGWGLAGKYGRQDAPRWRAGLTTREKSK